MNKSGTFMDQNTSYSVGSIQISVTRGNYWKQSKKKKVFFVIIVLVFGSSILCVNKIRCAWHEFDKIWWKVAYIAIKWSLFCKKNSMSMSMWGNKKMYSGIWNFIKRTHATVSIFQVKRNLVNLIQFNLPFGVYEMRISKRGKTQKYKRQTEQTSDR